jgi:hypothetical protein
VSHRGAGVAGAKGRYGVRMIETRQGWRHAVYDTKTGRTMRLFVFFYDAAMDCRRRNGGISGKADKETVSGAGR